MFFKYAHVSFMPLEITTLRKPTYPRCSEDNKYFQPATLPHVMCGGENTSYRDITSLEVKHHVATFI